MLYLTLRQFEYVAAVARASSLSVAAVQLNVSQPSLSVAISAVEKRLGQKLFIRRRGTAAQLTAFGEAYLASIDKIIALARQLDGPAQKSGTAFGRLTVGIFDDLAPFYLGGLLDRLRSALPEAEIRYRVADFETLEREMLLGRIDMAVTFDAGLDASFIRTRLTSMRPHAFLAPDHPLAAKSSVALSSLRAQPLILSEVGLSLRHMLGLFHRLGIDPVVRHRARSVEVMRSLAARGEGVGLAYICPRNEVTYDGSPLASVPVSDRIAEQAIILAQFSEGARTGVSEAASRIICEAFSGRADRRRGGSARVKR